MNLIGWWWNDVLYNPAGEWPSSESDALFKKNVYRYILSFVFLTFKPDGRHHDHNVISLLLGWIFFPSSLLGQMYEFITDVPAECQIPWMKIFPPWVKMLHLIRSFCHLHLSPFPQKFTAVTSQKLLFFFTPPEVTLCCHSHKVNQCSGCAQFSQNNLPLAKDKAKVLQSSPVKRAASKRAYAQQSY